MEKRIFCYKKPFSGRRLVKIMPIKEMELVDPKRRSTIDLRVYKGDIINAVLAIIPTGKVDVYQGYFLLIPL